MIIIMSSSSSSGRSSSSSSSSRCGLSSSYIWEVFEISFEDF